MHQAVVLVSAGAAQDVLGLADGGGDVAGADGAVGGLAGAGHVSLKARALTHDLQKATHF